MALPYISVEDCFPVIRQTILDTYKVDSFLMHYPYSDLEAGWTWGFAKWSGNLFHKFCHLLPVSRAGCLADYRVKKCSGLLQSDYHSY